MREAALQHLARPACHGDLIIGLVKNQREEILETGQLSCVGCQASYPVVQCATAITVLKGSARRGWVSRAERHSLDRGSQ